MLWRREPALLMGVAQTVLALVLSFGVSLDTEQVGAILAVTAAVLAVVTRSQVTSPATVAELTGPSPETLPTPDI